MLGSNTVTLLITLINYIALGTLTNVREAIILEGEILLPFFRRFICHVCETSRPAGPEPSPLLTTRYGSVLLYVLATLLMCVPFIRFYILIFLYSQPSVAKVVFFSFIARFEMRAWSVCIYRLSIFVSFVIS